MSAPDGVADLIDAQGSCACSGRLDVRNLGKADIAIDRPCFAPHRPCFSGSIYTSSIAKGGTLMGITRAQIASRRGRIERLSSHLEDGEKMYVPVYKGETRDEAILEFERKFGQTPVTRMWFGSDN
jgi:hypothetical protein